MLETLRIGLIRWNVAPLAIVAFLCVFMWHIGKPFMGDGCATGVDPVVAAAVLTLIGTVCGILWKMFNSIQANRGGTASGLEEDID